MPGWRCRRCRRGEPRRFPELSSVDSEYEPRRHRGTETIELQTDSDERVEVVLPGKMQELTEAACSGRNVGPAMVAG